jgi:hypothetical protein
VDQLRVAFAIKNVSCYEALQTNSDAGRFCGSNVRQFVAQCVPECSNEYGGFLKL